MRWGKHDDEAHGEWAVIGAPVAGTAGTLEPLQPGAAMLTSVDPSFDVDKFLS